MEYKEFLSAYNLGWQQKEVDDDKKTIPVQHAILDFQAMNLFYKIRHYRAKKPLNKLNLPTLSD